MHKTVRISLALGLIGLLSACEQGKQDAGKQDQSAKAADAQAGTKAAQTGAGMKKPPRPGRPQIDPPMDVATPPDDAVKTESGLQYKVLTEGTGDQKPTANDTVHLHYTIWKPNGETFFSTRQRDRAQQIDLFKMAPGWIEAVTGMKMGERRLVWMTPELASHRKGRHTPQETLAYEIELVKFDPAPAPPSDLAAAPADAKKGADGVAYKVLTAGKGTDKPRAWDDVTVHYTAWTRDGKLVENTTKSPRPQVVQLFRRKPDWLSAVQTMVEGQKNRIWIPADKVKARPGVPENTALVYDLELIKLTKKTEPPPVPKDVAAAPKDAKKTEKGVFYKVLKAGTGKEKPTATQTVEVHYTGWTTDGNMFDSSVVRGKTASFALNRVIPGWTDGLQTMVVGEKTRFWIPEEMAYKGQAGRPQGMLVFDVELLGIKESGRPRMPKGHPPMPPKTPPAQK